MAWTIAQLNDPDLAVRLANRIAFSEDIAYEKYDVTMLGTWDNSLPRSVNPKMIKDYIFINDTVTSLNPDVDCQPCDIPSTGCCPETNTLLSEILEKPTILDISGCYLFGGGLVMVEGFASVSVTTLDIIKLKATVTGKSDTVVGIEIGDVLNETQITMNNRRDCCNAIWPTIVV